MLKLHTSVRPLAETCRVQTAVELPAVQVEVFDCEWERPMLASARLRNHNLFYSLTPQPRGSQIRLDWLDGRFGDLTGAGLFPAGQEISVRSDGGIQRLLICRFDPQGFDALLDGAIRWDVPTRISAMDLREPAIRSTLGRMAREVQQPGLASPVLMEALSTSLVVDIGRYLDTRRCMRAWETGRLAPWQLRRVEERVRAQPGATPSLAEIAQLCGISVRQLVRAFKAATGQTVHQYFAVRQMDHARSLLAETELPLKAIAVELGFRQPASFTAAFVRACGETPSAYRLRSRSRR